MYSSNAKQKSVMFGGCLCEHKEAFKQIFQSINKEQEINGIAKIYTQIRSRNVCYSFAVFVLC